MSNCDFYAARDDMISVLEFTFAEGEFRVFEHSSEFGEELREFTSTDEIADAFDLGNCPGKQRFSALLALYVPSTSDVFSVRKIDLNPDSCAGHTFRYEPNGWGLIQLYFGGVSERGIHYSHTNHISENRAKKVKATYADELGSVDAWDWEKLSQVSRRLRYHIRNRLAVGKHGSRPVLPSAQVLVDSGCKLLPN